MTRIIAPKFSYKLTDTFMGFHCGNTPACKMCADRAIKYQLIQHRLLEPKDSEPDFTRGTLEGDIAASDITFSTVSSATLKACSAHISPRVKFCRLQPVPSAASVSLRSLRWDVFTVMC